MKYFGDIVENGTIHMAFNSSAVAGESATITGGTYTVYKDDATGSETTTGVTISIDHDGHTGSHIATIVCTNVFYAVATDYFLHLDGGTVDGKNQNVFVGSFSIENRTATQALVEGTITFQQAWRLCLSVMTGLSSGGGSTNLKFRDLADSKDRIDIVVDSSGNRITINTRDGT